MVDEGAEPADGVRDVREGGVDGGEELGERLLAKVGRGPAAVAGASGGGGSGAAAVVASARGEALGRAHPRRGCISAIPAGTGLYPTGGGDGRVVLGAGWEK